MDIEQALKQGVKTLKDSDSPEIDGQILLCYVLQCPTSHLHTWPEQKLTKSQVDQFEQLVFQRQLGVPVAHLIGQRGFWSLDLKVTADTLIPRPDTELLVSLALEKLTPQMKIADLGTGSGAIVLSLAQEQPEATFFALDYSRPALDVAKYNAKNNQIENVCFWQGSWLDSIADNCLDMVVSNPPYIEQDDPHLSQGDVRFEPIAALASGKDGLDDIRTIIVQAKRCLKPEKWLLIEHGYHQGEQVKQLFYDAGFIGVTSQQDFGDNDRVMMGQQPL